MKYLFYFFGVLVLLVSCKENPVAKPEKLIDKETMVEILYDVAILQAIQGYAPAKFNGKDIDVQDFIYKKYNIDSLSYYQNQKYYASNPKEYEKMYREVLERVEADELELDDKSKGNEAINKIDATELK